MANADSGEVSLPLWALLSMALVAAVLLLVLGYPESSRRWVADGDAVASRSARYTVFTVYQRVCFWQRGA